jgi:hypothetical protein
MSRQKTLWGWLLGALGVVIFLAVVAAATWRIFIYPWAQCWGATRLEQAMLLPGNEFVPSATSQSTYAIDIQAPPERAWMWLVQIGQDRAGFYSYSFLENLVGDPIRNVIEIRPEWQELKAGDFVHLAPSDYLGGRLREKTALEVLLADPPRALVLKNWGAFILLPKDGGRSTRFLSRSRTVENSATRLTLSIVFEPIHFLMQRRMMLGIKELAEAGTAAERRPIPSRADCIWFLSIVGAGLLIFIIALVRRTSLWLPAAALLTILLTFVLFRLPPDPLLGIGLAAITVFVLLWLVLPRRRRA